jgi:chemotaxis protein MotB
VIPRDGQLFGTIRTEINFWPSFVDILLMVLMVLVLQDFLRVFVSDGYLEMARIRQAQHELEQALKSEFRQEIDAKTISLSLSPTMLQIRFSADVLFQVKDYHLEPQGLSVINRCASVLRSPKLAAYKQIQVEGHTDSTELDSPVYPHNNWELAAARAITVVQQIQAEGIDAHLLSANGYGQFNPAVSNDTDEGKQKNRRVELRVIFSIPK